MTPEVRKRRPVATPRHGVEIVAHRGNAAEYPENTLPAFESALRLGVRHIELDVQLARDRVPIVIHDHTLARTTGAPGKVFDHDSTELARLEAAERGRLGDAHAGVCLPLLGDVLAVLCAHSMVRVFVEIKRASVRAFGAEAVVEQVLAAAATHLAGVTVISFDLATVVMARKHGARSIGWVLENYDQHTQTRCEALAPEYLFCNHDKLPPSGALWRGSWQWVIYEVGDAALARTLIARGAHLLETMQVRYLRAVLGHD